MAHDAIAKDSFIDALPVELGLKVRERDPLTLDASLHVALRLEAIQQAVLTREEADGTVRAGGRARAIAADARAPSDDVILAKLDKFVSRCDAQLQTIGGRMNSLESSVRRQQCAVEPQRAPATGQAADGRVRRVTADAGSSSDDAVLAKLHELQTHFDTELEALNGRLDTIEAVVQLQQPSLQSKNDEFEMRAQRECFICGDTTHLMRQCSKRNVFNKVGGLKPSRFVQNRVGVQQDDSVPAVALVRAVRLGTCEDVSSRRPTRTAGDGFASAESHADVRTDQWNPPCQPVVDGRVSSSRVWHVHAPGELAELQQADSDIGPIVRLRIESDEQPSMDVLRDQSSNAKVYWSQWPRLVLREGVVYRTVFDKHGRPDGLQLLVPTCLRSELMHFVHTGPAGSHVGVAKTMQQVFRRGWWPSWRADVCRQLNRCSSCRCRGARPSPGLSQPTRVNSVPDSCPADLAEPRGVRVCDRRR